MSDEKKAPTTAEVREMIDVERARDAADPWGVRATHRLSEVLLALAEERDKLAAERARLREMAREVRAAFTVGEQGDKVDALLTALGEP